MLVDSHCHLDFPEFAEELDQVVARAQAAGVGAMVTICTRLDAFDRVRAIAERYPHVFCSVGVHPHEAAAEVSAERLLALAGHPKVVGIGESGLDYYYEHSPRPQQQASFRAHIEAARESGLPLIVHTRDADQDTIHILADEMAKGTYSGLIHCFTAGREVADQAVEMGLYISLSGIVTFRNAGALCEIVRDLPLDRLLVETDAPFLAPAPMRGKRNEPAFVVHTATRVAEILGVSEDELAKTTTANFFALFRKARVPAGAA